MEFFRGLEGRKPVYNPEDYEDETYYVILTVK